MHVKINLRTIFYVFLLALVTLTGCQWFSDKTEKVKFSSGFMDIDGNSIPGGKVVIHAFNEGTDKPETFEFEIRDGKLSGTVPVAGKYVVNVKVKGYGLVSKIFYGSIPDRNFELRPATVVPFNPAVGGIIRDNSKCGGSLSARADWSSNVMSQIPLRINSEGKISGFGMSGDLQEAYNYHARTKPCNNDVTVSLPANAINTNASGISVAMSSIDLFSPDGMPGDYTMSNGQQRGFMESFGAFSIELYDDENTYNLNEKSSATVTFPLHVLGKDTTDIPRSVPLLYYDEVNGEWKKEGEALYHPDKRAYIGNVTHFSAINLDLEKFNTACLRFKDQPGDGVDPDMANPMTAAYRVEVTAPPTVAGGSPRVSSRDVTWADMDCASPDDRQFALTRLPSETEVSIVFFNTAATPIPHAVYVFKTGPTDTSLNDPSLFTCADLSKCGNFHLFDKTEFPVPEFYIASCRDAVSGFIIVSLAIGPPANLTFNPADYNIKISRGNGGPVVCEQTYPLTMPAIDISPPGSQVKLLQYKIAVAGLCNSGTAYSDETVELFDKGATPVRVSNTFYITNCN